MALYDQFTWAPGEGMAAVSENTQRQSQADLLAASTQETKVDTAKKDAELQEFMSQTAKDLRETEREAKLGKFKDDIANNDALQNYYKNNPNFRDERAAASAHGEMLKIQKETSEDEHTIERGETATYYDPKTGEVNIDNYGKSRDRLIKMGVHTEDDSPTVEELRSNPKAMDAVKRAATYTYLTQEQKVAQLAAEEKAKAEQKQQDSVNTAAMQRERLSQDRQDARNNADIAGRRDVAQIGATSRETVAGMKAARDAKVRDNALLNKNIPDLRLFGSLKNNEQYMMDGVTQFAVSHNVDADDDELRGVVSTVFPMAQSIYNEQAAQARQDLKDGKPYAIPKSVGEIALDLAKQTLIDPKQKANVKTWYQTNQKRISVDGELLEKPATQGTIQNSPPPAATAPAVNPNAKQPSNDPRDFFLPENAQPKLGPEAFGDDAIGKDRYNKYVKGGPAVRKATEEYFEKQHQEFIASLKGSK